MIAGFHWRCPAMIVRWLDGDTAEVTVDMGWRTERAREHVRLLRLYCPEHDQAGGPEAAIHAYHLAPPGTVVVLTSKALGKSAQWSGSQESLSRTLGDLELPDGSDFADRMVADGFGSHIHGPGTGDGIELA